MNLIELEDMLKQTSYPVKYSHFEKPVKVPYITYINSNTNNFIADNIVYKKISDVQIELYTRKKDLGVEEKLEKLLDENELAYETSEVWIEEERLFQKIYEVRLI
ncbi:hypothetical protein [Clostridium paraputrificum]|uniref:hypothetical protein n=1 Tax=Clostridium paraputrificum TaxID=29363 RepID=UPI000C068561|nr:hypothetical protein [Clostridium paraputrificum]